MPTSLQEEVIKGGGFLTAEAGPEDTFTPEDFTDEHRMIAETTSRFVDREVHPFSERLEQHDWALARQLIKRAGDLGLIAASVPREYGGLALDQTSIALIAENLGRSSSFAATLGADTGIGLLPIVYFGSEKAKRKYLPGIASGDLVTAYALTEAGSGSDALAAKATARLSDAGDHYVLNGEKLFVTNGGLADIFIVFAKVDGRKFSAFIVESQEGAKPGREERKMGIRGSSTTPLVLSEVKVPAENVLGRTGMGHQIAFGILNIGRLKLAATCVGAMKLMLQQATRYANERRQFGSPISSFGAIKSKLSEMAIRTWVGESMVYRSLGLIEAAVDDIGASHTQTEPQIIDGYAAECSIVKITLSEYCNYIADEMVQIYGGYGYSADYPAEGAYRDARINRIFEGTNEINRLLISSRSIKAAMNECRATTPSVIDQICARESAFADGIGLLDIEHESAVNAKLISLLSLRLLAQKNSLSLPEQQAVMLGIADTIIEAYAMESAILRARKISRDGRSESLTAADMVQVFCRDATQRVEATARSVFCALAGDQELSTLLIALQSLTKLPPINTITARMRIANRLIDSTEPAPGERR